MSRPARNRLLVVVLLVLVFALSPRLPSMVTWVAAAIGGPLVLLALWVTTPFRTARAALAQKNYDAAADALVAFERTLHSPWKRVLASMAVGLYTSNPEAAGKSTLGAVRLEQNRLDEARQLFDAAIALDPPYAIPYANLAVIAATQGDRAEAERRKNEAAERGYRSRVLDATVRDRLQAKRP